MTGYTRKERKLVHKIISLADKKLVLQEKLAKIEQELKLSREQLNEIK